MPAPAFLVRTPAGLHCPDGDFFLDPSRAVQRAVVTHAHSDHAVRGHHTVYCTAATAACMRIKFGAQAGRRFEVHEAGQAFGIGGVDLAFLHAGHLLGAVQVLMTRQGIRHLYTGDFKLQTDATCPPYQFAEADVLVTETTFARPGMRHPDAAAEIAKLNNYGDRNTVIAAYALGKAQRISYLLTAHCPGIKVFLHPDIRPFHRVYEEAGFPTGTWLPYATRAFRQSRGNVLIVPPRNFSGYRFDRRYHLAFASGWEHLQRHCDIPLFISDHADWYDLLEVVEKTGARRVWTVHGDGNALADHLGGAGIEVSSLH